LKIFHLKGLNGLRAIAATIVLVGHTLQRSGIHILDAATSYGVTIFFALSGFLITLLLLKEKEETNKISVTNFYIRRVLRIWPLYFFFIFLTICLVYILSSQALPLYRLKNYFFIIPNYSVAYGVSIDQLFHYWSLGVEEQFYLFWPLLVSVFAFRFLPFAIVFTILFLSIKIIISSTYGGFSPEYSLIYLTRFSCMAIGGIGAYLYKTNSKILNFVKMRIVIIIAWGLLISTWFNLFHLASVIDHEIASMATFVIITDQISGSKILSLESKMLNFLGKISFGIYVYHPLIIYLVIFYFNPSAYGSGNILYGIISLVVVAGVTIFIAHLSYKYFENPFLRLKDKFAIIKSEPGLVK